MNREEIYGLVLDKSIEKILSWGFADDHPLEKCDSKTQDLIKESAELAKQGRYDEAIAVLEDTIKQDPSYVGSRVRTMKYLLKTDQPFQALLVGGGVLVLSDDAKPRSQVWDMASGIAFDIAKQTNDLSHANEALAFANEATRLAPNDVVCAWNRLDVLLFMHNHFKINNEDEEADKYLILSKKALDHVIDFAKSGRGNVSLYWQDLILDAKEIFPKLTWWENKLSEMKTIDVPRNEELSELQPTSNNSTKKRLVFPQKAIRVAAMLAVLAWPVLYDFMFDSAAEKEGPEQTQEISKPGKTNDPSQIQNTLPSDNTESSEVQSKLVRMDRKSIELAHIERDDSELATPSESYSDINATTGILRELQGRLARIERNDKELA